jgi:hypothetical protein
MTATAFKSIRITGVGAAAIVCLAGLSFGVGAGAQSAAEPPPTYGATTPRYDANNELLLPKGFETWVFVGSNLGLAYRKDLSEMTAAEGKRMEAQRFHNIYINPEAYAHFLRTGEFPEPTVLVMEQFAAADKEPKGVLTAGSYNGQRLGLEVAVKNSARPDKVKTPWAYYDFTDQSDPKKAVGHAPAFPDDACESCHRKHASRDNVWVQFYPHLREAIK